MLDIIGLEVTACATCPVSLTDVATERPERPFPISVDRALVVALGALVLALKLKIGISIDHVEEVDEPVDLVRKDGSDGPLLLVKEGAAWGRQAGGGCRNGYVRHCFLLSYCYHYDALISAHGK